VHGLNRQAGAVKDKNLIGADPARDEEGASRAARVEQLFRQHNALLVSFLTSRLRSETEAHEVAQEAYVRMLQLEQPGLVSFQRAYLFKVASNLAIDRLRHRSVRADVALHESFQDWLSVPGADRQVLAEEEVTALQHALSELPGKTQDVFRRHFLGGETLQHIAREISLTDRMVRYHLARALAHCRKRLGLGSKE
jgi:RNA polymerase sigma factor (sigma-70 family)